MEGYPKNNNLIYESKIKELERQLDEEKNKNKKLIEENTKLKNLINDLKNHNDDYLKKIKVLENEILNFKSNNNLDNQTDNIINILKPGEKIMAINFVSIGFQDIVNYAIPCKNTDLFVRLEEKLNKDFPQLKEQEIYFKVNTRRIKRFKTLDENKIKSNDIINVFVIDS